jgi:DNA-binding winged helix-turn-helix (wHTH) protein
LVLPKAQVSMNSGTAPIPLPIRPVADGPASFRFPSRFARFKDFELDVQKQELYRSGIRIKLQTKVYEALLVLLEAPHEVIGREILRQRLWPGDSLVNFDANVNTTVNKLRQILGDSPERPSYVETIPRKGYSFVADVTFADVLLRRPGSEPATQTVAEAESRSLLGLQPLKWLTVGVIALVLSGMLFGAAVVLYMQRGH